MNGKLKMLFGLDYWCCTLPLGYFFKQSHLYHLEIHESELKDGKVFFYAPVYQRQRIKKVFKDIELIQTVGCLGFLFRQLSQPFRIILAVWCFVLFFVLSHTIFRIEYQSTSPILTKKIQQFLVEQGFQTPFFAWDDDFKQYLKEILKEEFKTEIAWLEISGKASSIKIAFNDKRYGEVKEYSTAPLIAAKQAMITRFDVIHGEKKVKLNQIVYPGDVLVDNNLIDAFGNAQSVYVEGQVWGKTWTTVSSELSVNESYTIFEPFHFLRLLYDCRSQIEKEISEGEQVVSERILQLTQNGSTFTIKVHYTCLEMISRQ